MLNYYPTNSNCLFLLQNVNIKAKILFIQKRDTITQISQATDPVVWGTPANFNWFRVLAALVHGI